MRLNCVGCGGSGSRTLISQVTCPSCSGRGYVQQWQQPHNPNENFSQAPGHVNCSQCYGRAFVEQRGYGTCPDCSGSGGTGFDRDPQVDLGLSNGRVTFQSESLIAQPNSGLGCAIFILIAGIVFAVWWGFDWVIQKSILLSSISPHASLYGSIAALWSVICIPLAFTAAGLRLVTRARFTIINSLSWAALSTLAFAVAVMGTGLMVWGFISVLATLLAAIISTVAALTIIIPNIGASGWRLWMAGLLILAGIGSLNSFTNPAFMPDCMVVNDARVWLAIEPVTVSRTTVQRNVSCAGVQLTNDGVKRRVDSGLRALPVTDEVPDVLVLLLRLSAEGFAYERSMSAFWATLSLAFGLSAALLATGVQLLRLSTSFQASVTRTNTVADPAPRWVGWAALAFGMTLVGTVAAWTGKEQAPAIALSYRTLRPLVLLAVTKPTLRAWTAIEPAFDIPAPESILEELRKRASWQRKQLQKKVGR